MKITIIHPDLNQSHIRLSERQTTRTLVKRLPAGSVIKRLGRTLDIAKQCQLSEVFTDGDVVEAVYTPLVRTRRLWNQVKKSLDPCMITLDTVEPRAKMTCGHAITPQALYDYCQCELEKGSSKITCPYVTNIKGETCGNKWEMHVITRSAAMTQKEKRLFQTKLHKNRIKQQEIESNNVYPDDVMVSFLHNSPKLQGCKNALTHRACPRCWSIIEHASGCLQMTCRYPSCGFQFCFRCLDEYGPGVYHYSCMQAPLQFTSGQSDSLLANG